MARRRNQLQFDELEPKGRGSILRSRAEVLAEQQTSGGPEVRKSGYPDSDHSIRESVDRTAFMKATYRICPEANEAIDEIKRRLRIQLKRRVTYEEIAEVALLSALADLTENRTSSFLVRWFSGDPEVRKAGHPEELTS